MPNPLRKSGGSNLSSGSKTSSSSLNSEEEEKKVTIAHKKNGFKFLTADQYTAALRIRQGILKPESEGEIREEKTETVPRGTEESTFPRGREESTFPRGREEDVEKVKAKACDRVGVSKECCKEVQPRRRDAVLTPVKGRDAVLTLVKGRDGGNVCLVCNGGSRTLLGCTVKGCRNKYHLECHDPPLKDVPPGDWHCSGCVRKNTGSGVLFSPEAVKSKLDAVKVELADPEAEVVETTKKSRNDGSSDSVQILKVKANNNGSNDSAQMLKGKAKVCGKGGVSKECGKEVQPRDAVLMAAKGRDDSVCVVCRLGGSRILLGCKGKGCKKKYHLECHNPPLKVVPPSDWHCSSCVKMNIESGLHFSPGAIKSNLDAVKVELADSEIVDTTKNKTCNKDTSSDCVQKLKEKPAHVVVSKFLEYWVPVKLSDVQLEQYCHILLSNSALLCSRSKPVEALRDVFSSSRKCCDHPYFLEPSLQKMLTEGLSKDEYLNVGIKASGKLQALDKILCETKKQGLRVVIIFQSSVGSTGISLGDVLDDVVRQRCGVDSYERVDCAVIVPSKQFSRNRLAAMNRFNDNEKGRMVFLLDRRACHTTVKLSSVDIVLLYDSELKVGRDFKVLRKITIDSRQEQLKVFRLFSLGTLEEKVLYQDVGIVDSQNLTCSSIHQLLRWGASYLFKELAELHGSSSSRSTFSTDHLLKELFGPLPKDAASPSTINSSIDVKVDQNYLGHYLKTCERDTSLPGLQPVDKDPSHVFWTKLLNRETPKWRYLPSASASQRIRKRVQYFDYPLGETGSDNDDATKKRRKVLTGAIDVGAHKPVVDKRKAGDANKEGTSESPTRDCSQFLRNLAVPTSSRYRKASVVSCVPASCTCKSDVGAVRPVVEKKGEVGGANKEGASGTPAGGDSSLFLPNPAVSTGAARFLKAGLTTSVPAACTGEIDKVSVQQELDGEIRESHQSCQMSLPPTSEPPCSVPPVLGQVELVNNSPAGSETPYPEIPVEDSSASVTASQTACPTQPPATNEHAELPSPVITVPLQSLLPLPVPIDKSAGGSGISDSGSIGGIPNPINHPRQSAPITSSPSSQSPLHNHKESGQVGLVVNSAPQPSTRLHNGIQSGSHDTSHPVGLPAQPATPELHSELPSNNDTLQDRMCKTPVVRDKCKGGSLIRVSDFTSLGVVPDKVSHPVQSAPSTSSHTPQTLPQDDLFLREEIRFRQSLGDVSDRIGHPLQSAPSTSSQTPQTLPQDDPFLREDIRLRQELVQAEKSCEEQRKRLASDLSREMQELAEKYNKRHHENDTQFAYARNGLDTKYNKLLLHSMLAGAFREKML